MLGSLRLNDHDTLGFHPQTQTLEPYYMAGRGLTRRRYGEDVKFLFYRESVHRRVAVDLHCIFH